MIRFGTIPETETSSADTPHRTITRDRDVSEGRTLHIWDLENLNGFHEAFLTEYTDAVGGLGGEDHVIVGVDPTRFIRVYHMGLGGRIVGSPGENGADIALLRLDELRYPELVGRRYTRVLLGSGDHIFAPAVHHLDQCGISVGVVAFQESLSITLAESASFVIKMKPMETW